jgi:hypothetical protein
LPGHFWFVYHPLLTNGRLFIHLLHGNGCTHCPFQGLFSQQWVYYGVCWNRHTVHDIVQPHGSVSLVELFIYVGNTILNAPFCRLLVRTPHTP